MPKSCCSPSTASSNASAILRLCARRLLGRRRSAGAAAPDLGRKARRKPDRLRYRPRLAASRPRPTHRQRGLRGRRPSSSPPNQAEVEARPFVRHLREVRSTDRRPHSAGASFRQHHAVRRGAVESLGVALCHASRRSSTTAAVPRSRRFTSAPACRHRPSRPSARRIEALQDASYLVGEPGGQGQLKRGMVERVLSRCDNGDLDDTAPLLGLLHRFATEAAREESPPSIAKRSSPRIASCSNPAISAKRRNRAVWPCPGSALSEILWNVPR